MAYTISDECIACGACKDECPVEAISEGDIYAIDADGNAEMSGDLLRASTVLVAHRENDDIRIQHKNQRNSP